jgi:hypothetical protein
MTVAITRKRITLAAAATVLVVAAALGVAALTSPGPPTPRPAPDARLAQDLTAGYRGDAVAQLPAAFRYREAASTFLACPGAPGRYALSSRFDLSPGTGAAGAAALTT